LTPRIAADTIKPNTSKQEDYLDFIQKLACASGGNHSLLCVGLDPNPELMPSTIDILSFNKEIIKATQDLVCAYKLNLAFYEALGKEWFDVIKESLKAIPANIPVIGDAKRSDIGITAKSYARSLFENLDFDAVTVNPYLGYDSVKPFIDYSGRGVFILCRTSNPGSADFQTIRCQEEAGEGRQLFELVAEKAAAWNEHGNIGLVVGATYPKALKAIRRNHPTLPLLIPGVGTQGGDLAMAVHYGVDIHGEKAIINASRHIIYASRGKDFARAAQLAASELRQQINSFRADLSSR
jgi:orotidine-5'-phosphate decarboxylase